MSYHHAKKYIAVTVTIFMLSGISILCFINRAQAEGPQGPGQGRVQTSKQKEPATMQNSKPAQGQNYTRERARAVKGTTAPRRNNFVDSRYHHNRSYPERGRYFRTLPRDHRLIRHGRSHYYYSQGVWYRPYGGRYIVIAPPFGLIVPFLPLFYTTIWIHGTPYYYANDTYYAQTDEGYMVVEPPDNNVSETPPPTDDTMESRLFIYPRQGQGETQQANDRYECHKWSVDQTNYDPTNISGVPADQIVQKRSDYQRAMAACLDARGYTVK